MGPESSRALGAVRCRWTHFRSSHYRRGDRERWERSVPAGARRGPDRAQGRRDKLITFHLVGYRPSGGAGGALLSGGGPLDVCDLAAKEAPERRLVPPGSRLCPVNDRATTRNDPVECERKHAAHGPGGGQRRRSENPALLPCQGGGRGFESRRPLRLEPQVRCLIRPLPPAAEGPRSHVCPASSRGRRAIGRLEAAAQALVQARQQVAVAVHRQPRRGVTEALGDLLRVCLWGAFILAPIAGTSSGFPAFSGKPTLPDPVVDHWEQRRGDSVPSGALDVELPLRPDHGVREEPIHLDSRHVRSLRRLPLTASQIAPLLNGTGAGCPAPVRVASGSA